MNEYDSNRIYDLAKSINYTKTNELDKADCYVLNTCHIREKATEKVYHDIGRIKKNFRGKKKPIIVVTGCVAQAEGDILLDREKYIDAVIGPQSFHKFNQIIKNIEKKSLQENLTGFDVKKKFDTLNYYKTMSPHYEFGEKGTQALTLVSVPSIFYGSCIEKGTVQIDYYLSGELAGRLEDVNRNGELIQTGPEGSPGLGEVAGVVLYNEGFLLLTGDWSLDDTVEERYNYCPDPMNAAESPDNPRWIYWGTQGYNNEDGTSADPVGLVPPSTAVTKSSYYLSMNGTNYIPTVTMLAHAKKGELNHSNNPTYLTSGQNDVMMLYSGGRSFVEKDDLEIKNTVYSPYADPDAEFKKQTWISKIGIYDENRNLIAIAKLARPILKTEDREFTFKLKLDF